jgi:hypothetical protein
MDIEIFRLVPFNIFHFPSIRYSCGTGHINTQHNKKNSGQQNLHGDKKVFQPTTKRSSSFRRLQWSI